MGTTPSGGNSAAQRDRHVSKSSQVMYREDKPDNETAFLSSWDSCGRRGGKHGTYL